ncbi:MAG: acyl-CoA dehydrogenase family protein [Thermoplasmata archaeon]
MLRDARVFPIVEGTTEIQELILARSLLPNPPGRNPL